MKDQWYRQCRFVYNAGKVETAWIPEHGAQLGKRLYFDDDETEIWTVQEIYAREQEQYLHEHQMAYRHQREMSDV